MNNDEMQAYDRITDALRAKSADDLRNAGTPLGLFATPAPYGFQDSKP